MSESVIRLSIFLFIFITIALLELIIPCREQQSQDKKHRWLSNLSIAILNTIILRILFPASAVGIAVWAENNHIGLANVIAMPSIMAGFIGFLWLDLVIYTQHVIFHKTPFLWRFHQMHHSDTEYDLTTALRFHPIEILISMVIKSIAILIIGAPVVAVIAFEAVLNASAIFNHGNINLSKKLDNALRKLIVTPDMHRIHHSSRQKETDSNYGFNFSLWDKIFGTYTEKPKDSYQSMEIGLEYFRKKEDSKFWGLLKQPFRPKR